jgi:cell wall-associated NlpC family hydrolase
VGKVAAFAVAGLLAFTLLMVFIGGLLVGGPDGLFGRGGPGELGLPGVVCASAAGGPVTSVAGFGPGQLTNAALIVAAGAEMKMPQRGQVIAVATAMAESGLNNLDHGDRDSVGLFQQRTNWGPLSVRMDPKASARLFYAHLLAVPGWQAMPLTVAAQRVQVSARPDAYAHWEPAADQVVGAALHITCQPVAPSGPGQPGPGAPVAPGPIPPVTAADPQVREVIARASSQIGVPYAWGGGSAAGPTHGISDGGGQGDAHGDPGKTGFDCSGLMVYAFSGTGITVPHQTQAIYSAFPPPITNRAAVLAGDMVLLSSNGRPDGIDHVGLYLGAGRVLDAPESGLNVRVEQNIWAPGSTWNSHFIAAVRPVAIGSVKNRA